MEIPDDDVELDPKSLDHLMQEVSRAAYNYMSKTPEVCLAPASPQELSAMILDEPPTTGLGTDVVLRVIRDEFLAYTRNSHHPMYFHQRHAPFAVSAISDLAVAVANPGTATYETGGYSILLEKKLIRWMTTQLGYDPQRSGGTFVSGGSEATLTGLLCARDVITHRARVENRPVPRLVFATAQTHYSVTRALHVLGLGVDAIVRVPLDSKFRMDTAALESSINEHAQRGEHPLAIVATSATTSTGSFDDLVACGRIAQRHNAWLHVDACQGGSVLLTPAYKSLVAGIDQADSVVWNPHKLMWVTTNCSAILMKRRADLAFALQPGLSDASYLVPGSAALEEDGTDIMRWTLACSRAYSGLRLYTTLLAYGTDGIRRRLERCFALAKWFHRRIDSSQDFEALNTPESNIVAFRLVPGELRGDDAALNHHNERVRKLLVTGPNAFITGSSLLGRYWMRGVVQTPNNTEAALDRLLEEMRRISVQVLNERRS